jgi:hypothetical protein
MAIYFQREDEKHHHELTELYIRTWKKSLKEKLQTGKPGSEAHE